MTVRTGFDIDPMPAAEPEARRGATFLWLELTGRCQLSCTHCYADSGPTKSHGAMTTSDWVSVIDDAADIGVREIQFIGGEPTLHPALPELVRHASSRGIAVEIYSNLVRIRADIWDLLVEYGVRLATSYYSDQPEQHRLITGNALAHRRTTENISKAIQLGVPIRVGIVSVLEDQRIDELVGSWPTWESRMSRSIMFAVLVGPMRMWRCLWRSCAVSVPVTFWLFIRTVSYVRVSSPVRCRWATCWSPACDRWSTVRNWQPPGPLSGTRPRRNSATATRAVVRTAFLTVGQVASASPWGVGREGAFSNPGAISTS